MRYEQLTVGRLYVDEIAGTHALVGDLIDFGSNADGVDVKFYGTTSGVYCLWDESANHLYLEGADMTIDGGDLRFEDSDILIFGQGDTDVINMYFNGTDFYIRPGSASEGVLIGTDTALANVTLKGTLTVGKTDVGHDVTFYGATNTAKIQWDESDDALEFTLGTVEFISAKSGAECFKFADDSAAACADLASAVATVNGVVKAKIGTTVGYIPMYQAFTAT